MICNLPGYKTCPMCGPDLLFAFIMPWLLSGLQKGVLVHVTVPEPSSAHRLCRHQQWRQGWEEQRHCDCVPGHGGGVRVVVGLPARDGQVASASLHPL